MATIKGTENKDILYGRSGESHNIFGRGGNDVLLGSSKNDRLYGEEGNDRLEGSYGSDTLSGGNGNDLISGLSLYGVGFSSDLTTNKDRDILYGGRGSDTFVLSGPISTTYTRPGYYHSNGDSDLAIIKDFKSGKDKIQLAQSADLYSLTNSGSNTNIYYQGDNNENDLVAIVQSNNNLNLASSDFTFV